MKVILDASIAGQVDLELRSHGHDVRRQVPDPGDRKLLQLANDEQRVLVTADKDFGELAVFHRLDHFGIVRLVDLRRFEQGMFSLAALAKYEVELNHGAILTVYRDRVRVRPSQD